MRTTLLLVALWGCERTITSNADCQAWADPCDGCVQQCTARWDVPPDGECGMNTCLDPLPACIADAGSCVFAD